MTKFHYIQKGDISAIPKNAGVYVFLNKKNILYIGKAANLQDRVKNHFTQPSYRDNLFIAQVTKIGYFETQSEIDALLLESHLIKKHQPKYNVMWKDDKRYFYVGITPSTTLRAGKEKLPRVFLTHQLERKPPSATPGRASLRRAHLKGSHMATNVARPPKTTQVVLGPFVEGKAIKQVLRLLRKVFPYYTAKRHTILPCPYCHIGLCPGPKPNVKKYKQNIKNLIAILKGRRVSVLKNLKKSMEQASKKQDFERAAVLRNQILSLKNIMRHSISSFTAIEPISLALPWQSYGDTQRALQKLLHTKADIARIEAYDISNIQGKQSTGSMVTFLNGKPAKEWYRKFKIYRTGKSNDFAMMQELISRRLKHTEWPYPDLMLIDGGKGQLSSALKSIGNAKDIRVVALAKRNNELFSPRKTSPVLLLNLPQEVSNLLLYMRDEAHRFAISYHRKLRRIDALKNS